MKKYLFIILLIGVWSCEDNENEEVVSEVILWGETYSVKDTDTLSIWNGLEDSIIPPEIGLLINLKELDLSGGEMIGEIPPQIGNLKNLKSLDLRWNDFSGSIPFEIGQLSNLEFLGLGDTN